MCTTIGPIDVCIGIRTLRVYFASSRSSTPPPPASLALLKEDCGDDQADQHDIRQAAQPMKTLKHNDWTAS